MVFMISVASVISADPQEEKKTGQRASFGAGYPADVHADIQADIWEQKLRSSS